MKICCDCEAPKALTEFQRESRQSDGLRRYCRPCAKKRKRNGFMNTTTAKKPNPRRRKEPDLPRPEWGWQDAAACRGEDLVLFFGPDGERAPEREIRERKAKSVCAGCLVKRECLAYAVSRPEKYGTWGSMNEDERKAERRRRQRSAKPATRRKLPIAPGEYVCYRAIDGAEQTVKAVTGRVFRVDGEPVIRIQIRVNGRPEDRLVPAGSVRKLEPVPEQPTGNWRGAAA